MSTPPRKSGWIKKLGITFGAILALLLVVYFAATSAWGLKTFVLPRVTEAVGAEVTVDDAGISPFSSVTLTGLKVRPGTGDPLFAAREVRLRYSLMDILGGNLHVDEVTIESPVVRVMINADGTANYDPILQTLAKNAEKAPREPKAKSGAAPKLDVRAVALRNATIHFTIAATNPAARTEALLSGVNLSVKDLRNGATAALGLDGQMELNTTTSAGRSELATRFSGTHAITLKENLQPDPIKGRTELSVTAATGTYSEMSRVSTVFETELKAEEILQKLHLTRGGENLGDITLSARYDLARRIVTGRLDIDGVGAPALALVGSRIGVGFGSTMLSAHYDFALTNYGDSISINGALRGDRVSLTRGNTVTPTMDLLLTNHVAVDRQRSNAVLHALGFTATQGGRPVLTAELSRALPVSWGTGAGAPEESSLEVKLNRFEFSPWRAFLPPNVALTSGAADARLQIDSSRAGQLISVRLKADVSDVTGRVADNQLQNAGLDIDLATTVTSLNDTSISNLVVRVRQAGRELASLSASGRIDAARQDVDLQTTAQVSLSGASAMLGRPDVALTDGTLNFAGRVLQNNVTPGQTNNLRFNRRVTGDLKVAGLSGTAAGKPFDRFDTDFNLDITETNQIVEILRAEGLLRQAGQDGGRIAATGRFDAARMQGRGLLKITNLNQVVLRTFLAGLLGDKSLNSGSVSTDLELNYDAAADSQARGTVRVANLLITDPQGKLPRVPLTAGIDLDAGLSAKGLGELRHLKGAILQGENLAGRFNVTGRYDRGTGVGAAVIRVDDLNQNALSPFLGAVLGERQLAQVHIDVAADASFDPRGESSLKATLSVTNLVIIDPSGAIPSTPLAIASSVDGMMRDQVLEIRPTTVSLAPTERAKNVIGIQGRVDLRTTNAIAGDLLVSSDSLDLTAYYNLFVDRPVPAGTAAATPAPAPRAGRGAPPAIEAEPAAITLPLSNFTFRAGIGRIYLREVDIARFTNHTRIDGGRVLVAPLSLVLNDAAISNSANLNLGVPGYEYDVTMSAAGIPLEPLVNSFAVALRDKVKGQLFLDSSVRGAGVTGTSLRRTLNGKSSLLLTNALVILPEPSVKMPKALGGVLIALSDVLRPIGPLIGIRLEDFIKPPITWMAVDTEAGQGLITLQRVIAQSDAFRIATTGTVSIADALMASPINKLPVELALSRALAVKTGLAPAGTPTNQVYVALTPNFISVGGTLAKVKVEEDKAALALLLGRKMGLPGNLTEGANAILGAGKTNAGGLLGGINTMLGGGKTTNSAPATNAPAGKKEKGGLLNLFK